MRKILDWRFLKVYRGWCACKPSPSRREKFRIKHFHNVIIFGRKFELGCKCEDCDAPF